MKDLVFKIKLICLLFVAITSIVGTIFLIRYIRSHNIVIHRVY